MDRAIGTKIISIYGLAASLVLAAIPEPDAVLYGPALVNGVAVQQRSAVVLVTRLPGGQEIGRFDFGDCNADGVNDTCELSCAAPGCSGVTGCGTARDTSPADGLLDDCPGHSYVLKARTESAPEGIEPSGNAAVLNPSNPAVVGIFMALAGGPEKFVRDLRIDERGKIRNIALTILNDFAFRDLQRCSGGPSGSPPGGACSSESFAAADYDEDGDVDLRDFAFVQNNFVPD
jgi:hypothetical protein